MMSDSDSPVSSPVGHEKQTGQESDGGSENGLRVFERCKRKIAETAAKQQQMDSDTEEDNDMKPINKRQKLQGEKEDSKNNQYSETDKPVEVLGSAFSKTHKKNKNEFLEKEMEYSDCEESDTDRSGDEKEESAEKPLRAEYVPERKVPHDENCSSDDSHDRQEKNKIQFSDDKSLLLKNKVHSQVSFNSSVCNGVENKSSSKEETSRESGNNSEDHNSIKSSLSKHSVQGQGKRSVAVADSSKMKSEPREHLPNSESEDKKSLNISQCALESDQDSKCSSKRNESLKENFQEANSACNVKDEGSNMMELPEKDQSSHKPRSNSDSEENELQATDEALVQGGGANYSEREVRKKQREQELVMAAESIKGKNSDSDSDEKPLKMVSNKTTKQRENLSDSGREDREEQQNMKIKEKSGRGKVSYLDSDKGKSLKPVLKRIVIQGDMSSDFGKEGNLKKQQKGKTKMRAGREKDSDSDSEEEKPLKIVLKKTTEKGGSASDSGREDSRRRQQKAKRKVEAKRRKNYDSESDSEEEKPLKTMSNKNISHRGGASDTNREGRKKKQQNVMAKVNTRKEKVSDMDSEEEKSAEESENLTRQSESDCDENFELNKSKPKWQEQKTVYSCDDNDEPLKASKIKTQIKESQEDEGTNTSKKNSDFDTDDEKPLKNSSNESHTNSDSSDIIVSESTPAKTKKTERVSSDCGAELDVSKQIKKSQRTNGKEQCGSDSDMELDALTKRNAALSTRLSKAVKDKGSAEDSTDSSDFEEDRSEKRSIVTKVSYHSMSSSESGDSSAGTRIKTGAIKTTSNKKKGNKSSAFSSDSPVTDDEICKKDKRKEGKKDVS
jgi:hypothetical protein